MLYHDPDPGTCGPGWNDYPEDEDSDHDCLCATTETTEPDPGLLASSRAAHKKASEAADQWMRRALDAERKLSEFASALTLALIDSENLHQAAAMDFLRGEIIELASKID